MSKKNLWEKEPYFAPDCELILMHLSMGLCDSGVGGNGGIDNPGQGGDELPFDDWTNDGFDDIFNAL